MEPQIHQRLGPPKTKPTTSVVRVADDWYVAATSKRLAAKPLGVQVLGIPMVLFRGSDGAPVALLDRCPHRNVPLSMGRCVKGQLECAYHGWQFDHQGMCTHVPGLVGDHAGKARRAIRYPTREYDGFVWVLPDAQARQSLIDACPRTPFRFPLLDNSAYSTVRYQMEVSGSLHAVAENVLDVPHTAFLHKGLFRKSGVLRDPLKVVVRRWHDRVEAEYVGEPRPPGLLGRILAPGGGTVFHCDRFVMPCICQVEYRLAPKSHLFVTTALTPTSDTRTMMNAVVTFRLPLPHWLVACVLRPVAIKVLKQDAVMLSEQVRTIERFGGEQFVSTAADLLGSHIQRLLSAAERGERDVAADPVVKEGWLQL